MSGPEPVFLLTDFGWEDPYVGCMKAVLHHQRPYPPVLDLTHDIPPQNEIAASFLLEYCLPDLPPESILLCVVDPGVGTSRSILAIRTSRGIRVVVPDTGIAGGIPWERVVRVENERFHRDAPSETFHGRDWFAPVGGYLSRGGEMRRLGTMLDRSPEGGLVPQPEHTENRVRGEIVYVDHFGNLITNLPPSMVPERPCFQIEGGPQIQGLEHHYEVDKSPIAIVGSFNRVELSVPRGSAREVLNADVGDSVTVTTVQQS